MVLCARSPIVLFSFSVICLRTYLATTLGSLLEGLPMPTQILVKGVAPKLACKLLTPLWPLALLLPSRTLTMPHSLSSSSCTMMSLPRARRGSHSACHLSQQRLIAGPDRFINAPLFQNVQSSSSSFRGRFFCTPLKRVHRCRDASVRCDTWPERYGFHSGYLMIMRMASRTLWPVEWRVSAN